MRVTPARVVVVVVTVLAVWFILMNRGTVRIHLWGFATINAAMWVVLLFMLLAGVVVGAFGYRRRQSRRGPD